MANAGLHNCSNQVTYRINDQKRHHTEALVEEGGHRNHKKGGILQHTCNGVSLLIVSRRNQKGIKAIVSHHINALNGSNNQRIHNEQWEGEKSRSQYNRQNCK